ncbi:MAG: ADOP family duplicated permease [Acidobacteriota bacterium]
MIREMLNRVRAFFAKSRLDDELGQEMQAHLEFAIEENLRRGLAPEEARRQALVRFGGMGQSMEQHREARGLPALDSLLQDLRYALRTLARDRGFTAVTVLILALGIAANTAVFSVVNAVLLRPLPFPDAGQLTWLSSGRQSIAAGRNPGGLSDVTYTVDAYEEIARRNRSFQNLTCYNPFFGNSEYTLTGRGEPQPVQGVMVEDNFFRTLGIAPALGRLFAPEECRRGGRPAVLLSHAFWQRQFAGDRAIVGQAVTLNKTRATVAGVLPPGFDFGSVFAPGQRFDVFVPLVNDELRTWGNTLALVGRLKPGVPAAQAQAEADVLIPNIKAAHPDWWGDYTSTITPLRDYVSAKLRRSLLVLWCAVGLILLIVCVNLSSLMLSRATARTKEFAMRSVLGAGRGRLFGQLLTESLVLAGAGALAGLGLAFAVVFYISRQESIALPLLASVRMDGAALAWTALVAASAAILSGLAPGLRASAGNLQDALKSAGHGMTAGRKQQRLRGALVVSEVALACVLLIGAGLLLRSFLRVLDVDLGFQPSRAAVIKLDYDGSDGARRGAILEEMLRNVRAIPGVEAAGVADMLPLGRNRSWGLSAKGKVYGKEEDLGALVRIVTPGYFAAMGMRLEGGRDFAWSDTPTSEPVVIINRTAAKKFWRGEDPVGTLAVMSGRDTRVAGVIADVREHSLEEKTGPEMYLPVTQAGPEGAELVVRTKLPPEALAGSLMKTLRALNPAQPAAEFRSLQHIVDRSVSPRRFFVLLVASFAGLALLLASLGIYGVVSYSVARQSHEIGIRMALGATAPQVQLRVVGEALRVALAGVALGAVGAYAAAKWIASLLFGTAPTDPATFASIVLLLCAVAFVAGYIPARRASQIDPTAALRSS